MNATQTDWLGFDHLEDIGVDMSRCTACGSPLELGKDHLQIRRGEKDHVFCCPMCVSAFEAASVQRSMIPDSFESPSVSMFIDYLPALQIGGDYAYAHHYDDQKLCLMVGDVSGHGIGASLRMSSVSSEVERLVQAEADLREIAFALDCMLRWDATEKGLYLTLFCSLIDLEAGHLSFINCGHPAPRVWSAQTKSYTMLKAKSPPVGFFSLTSIEPDPTSVAFSKGDKLVLFTDGLSEFPIGDSGEQFGEDGIRELAQGFVDDPSRQSAEQTFEQVKNLRGNNLRDDIILALLAF